MLAQSLACVALLAFLVPYLATQQRQVPGAIRSAVVLVPVDVRVLDRDGNPVTDLKAADFTVLEDGAPQTIEHFSAQALENNVAVHPGAPQLRRHVGLEASPLERRTFLIVLGRGRLVGVTRGLDALKAFVRTRLLAQDLVAVQAYGRTTELTTSREPVIRLLERYEDRHPRIEALLDHWFAGLFINYRGEPPGIEARIDDLFDAPGLPPVRRLAFFDPVADDGFEDARREAWGGRDVIYNPASRDDHERLLTAIEYLRYFEGEKHLLFLTEEGLLNVPPALMQRLASSAADARISISTIRTGGVSLSWSAEDVQGRVIQLPQGPSLAERWANADLRALATHTGGLASTYKYASEALDRIERASRFQYVIGYHPTRSDWHGDERRIEVRVARPGVTVLHRASYVARRELVPFDRRAFLTESRIAGASGYRVQLNDITVRVGGTVVRDEAHRWQAKVQVTIDPATIAFAETDGRRAASIDIAVFAGASNLRQVGEIRRRIELKLEPDTYARMLTEGFTFEDVVNASARPRFLKVVVYDYAADKVASVVAEIR